ncbi:MAG: hypothetical protein GC192_20065 [Bacteroidetes bacterium]|nr:hypothetical protein [Bacteroidota bacterium]
MKIASILFLCLFFNMLFAQSPVAPTAKGAAPMSEANSVPGITRALVIGISNYQEDGIPDLKYADKDAKEFVKFLKSKGGGSLKDEQIKLLTNEQATYGQIYAELDWLLETSGPDDQVLIYFSGHGDVETKTKRQPGFLLAYDTPPTNYMIGALRLNDLNDYLETLVDQKAKIIVITDACHSGNLAGGRDGVLATATALSSQFMNQVKIMSCQPNEISLEGEQWGGGRGVFSYHLIDGLVGMADSNKDDIVTLSELERYLDQTVPVETDQQQYPNTTGAKGTKLVQVDPVELVALMAERAAPQQMKPITSKGLETDILAAADTSVQELYQEFLVAVDSHYFLPSDINKDRQSGRSASELYDILSHETSLAAMQGLMKRNFAAALQDDSQQAINAYLRADQAELNRRWNDEIDHYKTNPLYLAKAASVLGKGHVLYNQLIAKQYYFEGLIKRLEGGKLGDTIMLNQALALEFKALELDSGAAYVYNEIGLIYDGIRLVYKAADNERMNSILFQKQLDNYEAAMELAPKWVMPYHNASYTYREWRKFDMAEEMAEKTVSLDSSLYLVYERLAFSYYYVGKYSKAIELNKKIISLNPDSSLYYYNIACLESLLNHNSQSLDWLELAIQHGYKYEQIETDSDLENIRSEEQYKLLIQKYFPEKR